MKPALETIQIPQPIPYAEMLEIQQKRRQEVMQGQAPNTLYLLQHLPVITLGRQAHADHLLLRLEEYAEHGIELVQADRGGDVTYHGPGQLVAYPILNLCEWRCSVGWYMRSLEEVLIRMLAQLGITAERLPGYTGVWVNGSKIAAIGVGVHHWITLHGTALNIRPDMNHFRYIIPCGIADKPVASLQQIMEQTPDFSETAELYNQEFRKVFLENFERTDNPSGPLSSGHPKNK